MELRQLRYFVAVAEHLNFSKAARAVHITQSTISHQIRQLEHELGYKLFDRDLRQVRLTAQGEALLPGVVRIMKDLDNTIRLARVGHAPLREHVRVIGGVLFFNACLLSDALKRFNARCPDVSIEIDESFSNDLISRFEDGDYDLAVGVEEIKTSFAFEPLCQEEIILVVPPGHRMAGRRRARLVELHGERLAMLKPSFSIRREIDRCFESVGAEPQIVAEFENPNTLVRAAVAQGLGGIVTHNFPEWLDGLRPVKIHLEDPTPLRTIGLYRREDRPLSVAAQILSEIFADQIRDTSRGSNELGLRPCENGA